MEFDAVYTTEEVAKLFKCSPNAVRSMEDNGTLHRLPSIPGVKFSGVEVAQYLGKDYKSQRLEMENKQLRKQVASLQERLTRIMTVAQGGGIQ
jgi:DNA-binding transcriptional MerR regulator